MLKRLFRRKTEYVPQPPQLVPLEPDPYEGKKDLPVNPHRPSLAGIYRQVKEEDSTRVFELEEDLNQLKRVPDPEPIEIPIEFTTEEIPAPQGEAPPRPEYDPYVPDPEDYSLWEDIRDSRLLEYAGCAVVGFMLGRWSKRRR